jgi:hypothetical protein
MQLNSDKQNDDLLDDKLIQAIVNKLGYSSEDVRKYVKEENSFVSVLYNKLLEDQVRE